MLWKSDAEQKQHMWSRSSQLLGEYFTVHSKPLLKHRNRRTHQVAAKQQGRSASWGHHNIGLHSYSKLARQRHCKLAPYLVANQFNNQWIPSGSQKDGSVRQLPQHPKLLYLFVPSKFSNLTVLDPTLLAMQISAMDVMPNSWHHY